MAGSLDTIDTMATLTGTQALTNKTLTSPTINTPTITAALISRATGTGLPPSVSVLGGSGAGAAVSVTGNEIAGSVNLTTGTGTTNAVPIFRMTFLSVYPNAATVLLIPVGNAALNCGTTWISSGGAANVDIAVTVNPAASTAMVWRYIVIGY